jgi:AcrR family transcriptional regulator
MGRPREHDDEVRVRLLAAAEQIVGESGPNALSVRTVADAVGTTTRAVYSVFGSKGGLLEALAIRLFELLSSTIDAIAPTDDPVNDLIAASLHGFRHVALEHSALYNLVFLRVVPDLVLGPEFALIATATFAKLEALVGRIEADRGLANLSVPQAARTVHALTEGLATMELRGALGPAATADAAWHDALTGLLAGLIDK